MRPSSEITYSHEWIYDLENKLHWKLYWHQLDLILNISDVSFNQKITEIGVGSGLVSNYLKNKGYKVLTLDIDKNKNPDIVANIVEDELPHADIYLAFEILEHIPYSELETVLKKLSIHKVEKIFFSVPHASKTYFFSDFWLPYFGDRIVHIKRKRNYINTKNHHWELGINGITVKRLEILFKEWGYNFEYTYRYRNHQFFIANLEKGR